jgi:DNA repair protein RadA/Sms
MISSYQDKSVPSGTVSFGEIGLTGDLRQVPNAEDRIKEAARMGMKKVVMPSLHHKKKVDLSKKYGIEVCECNDLKEVMAAIF